MATQEMDLTAGEYVDVSAGLTLAASTTYAIAVVDSVSVIDRKGASAQWRLGATEPDSAAPGHALRVSHRQRGSGSIRLQIPSGEKLWIRGENSGASILVTAVG